MSDTQLAMIELGSIVALWIICNTITKIFFYQYEDEDVYPPEKFEEK